MKFIILLALLMSIATTSSAQLHKPRQGDFQVLPDIGHMLLPHDQSYFQAGLKGRSFKKNNRANKFYAGIGFNIDTPIPSGNNLFDQISVNKMETNFGIEYHKGRSSTSSFYYGPNIGFVSDLSFKNFNFGGGIISGFDWHPCVEK